MKKVNPFVLAIVLVAMLPVFASAQKLEGLDASPADIAYLRPEGRKSAPVAKVVYCRPQKKGRTMLGGTEPYGKVWRAGANDATEIKFYKDVTFGDKKVKAGTYTLYAIPEEKEWTVIINTKLDTWGAYDYEESKDVARVKVPVTKPKAEVEAFTIEFEGKPGEGKMFMAWENTLVEVPIKF